MIECYKELLSYTKSAVTRNYSEKSIDGILEYVSGCKNTDVLRAFYETTLDVLADLKNDR